MTNKPKVTRRDFLKRGSGSVALSLFIGGGLAGSITAAKAASKATPLKVFTPPEARTLLVMARTLFPHDFLADDYYLKVVTAIDDKASSDPKTAAMVRDGLVRLGNKFSLSSEIDREQRLRPIEKSPFFIFVHGETLNKLYGNPELWKLFGYEGSSVDLSSFDDIDWLPNE